MSWNWASRSTELKRIIPEQPYEWIEARLPPKLVITFRRYGAKPVNSEDEDEDEGEDEGEDEDKEVYVLRGITLPYIDYVRSCSHSKINILHRWRKGQAPSTSRTTTNSGTIEHCNGN